MSSYQLILVRDDGEQRKIRAVWDKSVSSDMTKSFGLNLEDEVAKYVGYEIQKEIKRWEDEDSKARE